MLVSTASVHAIGFWNLPGNSAQWWGYGWGAGHHACMVLGPKDHSGVFAHNNVRLPYSPRPPYYGCTSCDSCGGFGGEMMLLPASPAFAPNAPAIAPAGVRREFAPLPYHAMPAVDPAPGPHSVGEASEPEPALEIAPIQQPLFGAPVEQ